MLDQLKNDNSLDVIAIEISQLRQRLKKSEARIASLEEENGTLKVQLGVLNGQFNELVIKTRKEVGNLIYKEKSGLKRLINAACTVMERMNRTAEEHERKGLPFTRPERKVGQ